MHDHRWTLRREGVVRLCIGEVAPLPASSFIELWLQPRHSCVACGHNWGATTRAWLQPRHSCVAVAGVGSCFPPVRPYSYTSAVAYARLGWCDDARFIIAFIT